MNIIYQTIDDHNGKIESLDYRNLLTKAFDKIENEAVERLDKSLPYLYSAGDEQATDKLSNITQLKQKYSVENTISKKAVRAHDKYKEDMDNRRNQMGYKIKSLMGEMKDKILGGIQKGINRQPLLENVIKEKRKLKDKELAKQTDAETRVEIKKEIKELYTKEKSKLNRVIRTESINSAARAQLLKFQEADITEVRIYTSHDETVCAKCRNLERSQRVFSVDKLISVGAYPLSTITHPQCRCVFMPIIPDIEEGNDVGRIRNIPRNETNTVRRLVKDIELDQPIEFVEEITDHPVFVPVRQQYYEKSGIPSARAKLLAENDQSKLRGKVNTLEYVDSSNVKRVLLDVKADRDERHAYKLARIKAKDIYDAPDNKKIRNAIRALYKEKSKVGKDQSYKKLFFNAPSVANDRTYFVEGYAHYVVHPEVLKEYDPELYEYIKLNIFKMKEFMRHAV